MLAHASAVEMAISLANQKIDGQKPPIDWSGISNGEPLKGVTAQVALDPNVAKALSDKLASVDGTKTINDLDMAGIADLVKQARDGFLNREGAQVPNEVRRALDAISPENIKAEFMARAELKAAESGEAVK
jgi:hypothetical protein